MLAPESVPPCPASITISLFLLYCNNELYRLGIVYILPDNSLSPVFNIRGGYQIGSESETNYTEIDTFDPEKNRIYINISEDNYQIAGS